MLRDAVGDIEGITNGAIKLHLEASGSPKSAGMVRYNCYLRAVKVKYNHLLFQVTAPVPGPWPATIGTPVRDQLMTDIQNEERLRDAIKSILEEPSTGETVHLMLGL